MRYFYDNLNQSSMRENTDSASNQTCDLPHEILSLHQMMAKVAAVNADPTVTTIRVLQQTKATNLLRLLSMLNSMMVMAINLI